MSDRDSNEEPSGSSEYKSEESDEPKEPKQAQTSESEEEPKMPPSVESDEKPVKMSKSSESMSSEEDESESVEEEESSSEDKKDDEDDKLKSEEKRAIEERAAETLAHEAAEAEANARAVLARAAEQRVAEARALAEVENKRQEEKKQEEKQKQEQEEKQKQEHEEKQKQEDKQEHEEKQEEKQEEKKEKHDKQKQEEKNKKQAAEKKPTEEIRPPAEKKQETSKNVTRGETKEKELADWEITQKKAFTHWVNSYLSSKGLKIEELGNDFKNTNLFITFLECLTATPFESKYHTKPKMKVHHLENAQLAINYLKNTLKVPDITISPDEIVDGIIKMMLGFCWVLLRFFGKQQMQRDGDKNDNTSFEDSILNWVRDEVKDYSLEISSFRTSFNDGKAFLALCHKFNPASIDYHNTD